MAIRFVPDPDKLPKPRSKAAKALERPEHRQRVVPPKKGKGAKQAKKGRTVE